MQKKLLKITEYPWSKEMKTNELLNGPEYWIFEIQHQLYELINKYLEKNNLTQTEFASELGVGKSYISQVLNGNFDHKLSKFVELSLATGNVPLINFVSFETAVNKYKSGNLFANNVNNTSFVDFPANIKNSNDYKTDININHVNYNFLKNQGTIQYEKTDEEGEYCKYA